MVEEQEPPVKRRSSPKGKPEQPEQLLPDAPLQQSSTSQGMQPFPHSVQGGAAAWPPELLAQALELGAVPLKPGERADVSGAELSLNLQLTTGL